MPSYVFHLHDGVSAELRDETIDAADLEEARDLARIRLLLSTEFTHVEVYSQGHQCLRLDRADH